jgi:hypothetical protein
MGPTLLRFEDKHMSTIISVKRERGRERERERERERKRERERGREGASEGGECSR